MPTNDQIILRQYLAARKCELAPELAEASYFELFAAEQVLKDYDLSYDEIEAGMVGKGGDGGIDSVHIFINGDLLHEDSDVDMYRGEISIEVHIIQAKQSDGFSENAIHRLRASAMDLLDLSKDLAAFNSVYDAKLLSIIKRLRDAYTKHAAKLPKLALRYSYATVANEVHPNVERQVSSLEQTVRGLFSSAEFSFEFLGARELLKLARMQRQTSYFLQLAETPISVNNSFICLVRLHDYRAFISDEHGRYRRAIFDANVRDYQGDVEVNKAIRQSLQEPGEEDFWWLNNGVTIIAAASTLSGKMLTIRNPQVVNGLQTSQEIYRTLAANSIEERSVLVRVINAQSPASYQRIVRATNSQTLVPPASLRATDPFHRDIEDYLKDHGIYYERRKNYYRNDGRPRDRIVSISYVAQAVMAIVLGRPDDARARPSTLIKNDEDYRKVFNPKYPIQVFLFAVLLTKSVEAFLRSRDLRPDVVNNLRYHLSMFAVWRTLNQISPSVSQIAQLRVDDVSDNAFLSDCLTEVQMIYEELGGDDQVAKGPKFVDRLKQRLHELMYQGKPATLGQP